MKCVIIFIFGIFLFLVHPSLAETIHVPADVPTIKDGIDLAVDGDTVLVAEGRYYENINFLGKAITVASHFLIDSKKRHIRKTIIDGSNHPCSVVSFKTDEDSLSILTGFTITGGTGSKTYLPPYTCWGGGIYCVDSSPALRHNIIKDNQCSPEFGGWQGYGGGIYAKNSSLKIEHCKINSNSASFGGGIYSEKSDIVLKNNFIHKNKASLGGGLAVSDFLERGITISSNIISANQAIQSTGVLSGYGGGLLIANSFKEQVEITDNYFNSNLAKFGGAGICCEGIVSFQRNLFVNNTVENGKGGGLFCSHLGSTIAHNTLDNNSADKGAGIYVFQDSQNSLSPVSLLLNNNITNSKGQWGIFSEVDTALIITNNLWNNEGGNISCSTSYENISADPQYMNSSNHNYKLKPTSPCIDAGTASVIIDGDTLFIMDESEYFGVAPDMGAFESHYAIQGKNLLSENSNPENNLKNGFHLKGNFPNPFNPSTKISFYLAKSKEIRVKGLNLLEKFSI